MGAKSTNIIGVTSHESGNHDSSVALFLDSKLVFAEAEERATRVKHDRKFPLFALKDGLKSNHISLSDFDYIASGSVGSSLPHLIKWYSKGFLYAGVKNSLRWFSTRLFLYLQESIKSKNTEVLPSFRDISFDPSKIITVSHHLAHAEAAYMYSGRDDCLVVVWDGYGPDENGNPQCGAIYTAKDGELTFVENISVYTSLALYYGAVTIALGFKINDGEGKTMGLAPYGKSSGAIKEIEKIFPTFNGKKWISKPSWLEVIGVSRKDYFTHTPTYALLSKLIKKYGAEQVAYAAQFVLEKESSKYFKYLVRTYKKRTIVAAGGIFLNVKMNMLLLKDKIIDDIFIYPNPGDGGVAIGAAIAAYKRLGLPVKLTKMDGSYYGCEYSNAEIEKTLKSFRTKITYKQYKRNITKIAARHIADGKVIGWFQGKGEWGPRALGNRSVIADPRNPKTRDRINEKLKQRDWFMPFAPSILEEYKDTVLEHGYGTEYMTLTDDIKRNMTKKIPAAIHIDNTARSQIVSKKTNKKYWQLIRDFYSITGVPVVLNTSFNKHGLPIVHTPKEAVEHLLWGCIEELVIGDFIVTTK